MVCFQLLQAPLGFWVPAEERPKITSKTGTCLEGCIRSSRSLAQVPLFCHVKYAGQWPVHHTHQVNLSLVLGHDVGAGVGLLIK